MPQMFANPAEIAAQQEQERLHQLAREQERQERERREYERLAAAGGPGPSGGISSWQPSRRPGRWPAQPRAS